MTHLTPREAVSPWGMEQHPKLAERGATLAAGFVHFTLNFFKNYSKNLLVKWGSRAAEPLCGLLAYLLGNRYSPQRAPSQLQNMPNNR